MADDRTAPLAQLQGTATVAIVTTRKDGTPVATPIWAVVVDGTLYVRAAYGDRTIWYRRAVSARPTAVSLADGRIAERDPIAALAEPSLPVRVRRVDPADPVQAAVTEAFRAKYLPIAPEHVPPVVDATAIAHTLTLIPA